MPRDAAQALKGRADHTNGVVPGTTRRSGMPGMKVAIVLYLDRRFGKGGLKTLAKRLN
jgi:hypothetical protein